MTFSQTMFSSGVSVPGVDMVEYTENLMAQLHNCVVFQRMTTEEDCERMIEEFFVVQEKRMRKIQSKKTKKEKRKRKKGAKRSIVLSIKIFQKGSKIVKIFLMTMIAGAVWKV